MEKFRDNNVPAHRNAVSLFTICAAVLLCPIGYTVSAYAGSTGWWTDYDGKNYYGDPPSSSSSSSSGWTRQDQREYEAEQATARAQYEYEAAQRRQGTNLNNEAIRWENAGHYDKAISLYQQALKYSPNDTVILRNLQNAKGKQANAAGNKLYEQGNFEKAIAYYEQAAQFLPGNKTVLGNLAGARRGLQGQQERRRNEAEEQARRDVEKAQMDAAGARIKGMIGGMSKQLTQAPAPTGGGLGFKKAGSDGGKIISGGPVQSAKGDADAGLHPLAFKNMTPVKPAIIDFGGDGTRPAGGSKTVLGQLKSVEAHSRDAKAAPFNDMASDKSRLGFDTAGVAGDGLATSPVVNIPEAKPGWVMIPNDQRTPALNKLETQRTAARDERIVLEKKLADMESKPGANQVEIVRMREKVDQLQNKENYYNFSIQDELGKAPDVRKSDKK
jgi:tetratricopeptide (TPR) repeat protein